MKLLFASLLLVCPLPAAKLPALIPLPQEATLTDGQLRLSSPCVIENLNRTRQPLALAVPTHLKTKSNQLLDD